MTPLFRSRPAAVSAPWTNPHGPTSTVASSLGSSSEQGQCEVVNAGDGWVNTFMPQSERTFSVGFELPEHARLAADY